MEQDLEGEEIYASDIIKDKYSIYAEHVILNRYPNQIDGLKNIHRRILYVVRNDTKHVKISSITGRLVEKYHAAGDISIDAAIKRMAQPFNCLTPFMESSGNIGTYGTDDSAAPRYLEIGMSDFAKDMFYKGINVRTLKMVPTEDGDNLEPAYFIPKIPTSLLSGSFAIGIGYRSVTPSISLSDLCDLTISYIRNNKRLSKSMSKYLLPDFPIASYIRNKKSIIKNYNHTNYEQAIEVDGTMILKPNEIVIRTIPYGQAYHKKCSFKDSLADKNSYISKYVQRKGEFSKHKEYGDTVLYLKRGVDPFTILEKVKQEISFSKKYHPSMYYVDNRGKQIHCNHSLLLHLWYTARYRSVLAELKYRQNALILENRHNQALLIAINNTDEINKVFKNANDIADTYIVLNRKYGLSGQQVNFLADNFSIKFLTKLENNDLLRKIENNKKEIEQLQYEYAHVDDKIISDVEYIKQKYSKKFSKKTKFNTFIGYVHITGRGVIQFRNLDEYQETIKHFKMKPISLHLYPTAGGSKYKIVNNIMYDDHEIAHPKEFSCDDYVHSHNTLKHTIVLSNKTIYRLNGVVCKTDPKISFISVDDAFITIDKLGNMEWVHYSKIPLRKAISSGVMTTVKHICNFTEKEGVVCHVNEKEPNIVRLSKITKGVNSKIIKSPMGKMTVLGVYSTTRPILLSIPDDFIYKCKIRHMYIKDPKVIMTSDNVKINLRKLQSGVVDATTRHFKF